MTACRALGGGSPRVSEVQASDRERGKVERGRPQSQSLFGPPATERECSRVNLRVVGRGIEMSRAKGKSCLGPPLDRGRGPRA